MAIKTPPKVPRAIKRAALSNLDEPEFLKKLQRLYQADYDADEHNLIPAREDIAFVIGDQWNPTDRYRRERLRKPVITVNRLPAFVAQFLGSWMQTDLTVKLSPKHDTNKAAAQVRQGIIRTIMNTRMAKYAKQRAMTTCYIAGIGNFGVKLVEAEDDVFARDIQLEAYDDPFSVIWDRASKEPTGADANHVFTFDYLTREDFDETYPEAKGDSGWFVDELTGTAISMHSWEADDMIRVCYYWQMRHENVTLGLEAGTNDVIDITDMTPEEYAPLLALDDQGEPILRETTRPYAECYVCTASRVLEGPFRLDIPRLPIFRMEGWTMHEASVKYRWGFVRNAKDPQRLHNFWRSILAEELHKSVASKWLLDKVAMKNGLADEFRRAHTSGDNIVFWDSQSDGAKPEQIGAPPINQAVLTEASMTVQDIKDVTNKHEASMGMTSNEVSGKAITARQRVSELGDVVYHENGNGALAESGRVINAMIDFTYDTYRVVKVTGEDDKETMQAINGDFGDKTPDMTKGRYAISYSTGPSYATKRQEAVDTIMTLMNTMPQVGNVVADILVRNMDIPGADEISARLASLLPPGMINPEDLPPHLREPVIQRMQAQQQAQQQQQVEQMAQFRLTLGKLAAEIAELQSRAAKQHAQADKEEAAVGTEAMTALLQHDANSINAAKAGISMAQVGQQAFQFGLEAATSQQSFEQGRESLEKQADSTENQQGAQPQGRPSTPAQPQSGTPPQTPSSGQQESD